MAIRVGIVEDQRIVSEILQSLLARESDMQVVGVARTGREGLDLAERERPDILLLDISLPDMDGIAVARAVSAAQPQTRLVALSMHSEARFVDEMLQAGARGYVTKSATYPHLLEAIRAVADDRLYLSPGITPDSRANPLAPREREVLALIAAGRRSPDIAQELGISVATVEVHRRNIMRKLGLHTVAELTKFAIRNGLTPP